jgi:mRNA interferase MazF
MAVAPEHIRRGAVVLVRLPGDKARPAVVVRSDLLAPLSYATILPLTTEMRPNVDFRLTVQPTRRNGLREPSQVMADWPYTVRIEVMGTVIGHLDAATMRRVTESLAVVLGIGDQGAPSSAVVRQTAVASVSGSGQVVRTDADGEYRYRITETPRGFLITQRTLGGAGTWLVAEWLHQKRETAEACLDGVKALNAAWIATQAGEPAGALLQQAEALSSAHARLCERLDDYPIVGADVRALREAIEADA